MRSMSNRTAPSGLTAVLDIGSSKICCLIAAPDAAGAITLVGYGHQRSSGVKSGMITDSGEAERVTRQVVAQAERMAGVELNQVTVAIGCGKLRAQRFTARARVDGQVVTACDIDRVMAGGEAYVARSGRMLVHLDGSSWSIDGSHGVADPRGMAARELAVDLAAVTADDGPVRNLLTVVERCHLDTTRLVPEPVASAYSVTTPEERRAGVLVVDIGAGTTTFAAFVDNSLVAVETLPVGGNLITFDIANVLVTSVAEAERIKTLYGTLVKAASDASDLLSYPVHGPDGPIMYQTSREKVRSIIAPRVEQIFGLVAERLAEIGCGNLVSARVRLTGGTGQLIGLDQAWMRRFGGDVQCAQPRPIGGMPGSLVRPSLAALIGMVQSPVRSVAGTLQSGRDAGRKGYLKRMQRWIGDGF
jgi:cell division protein FtsA